MNGPFSTAMLVYQRVTTNTMVIALRWTMKPATPAVLSSPKGNPKFQCCLWAARLGPVDKKKSNPNAEEAI